MPAILAAGTEVQGNLRSLLHLVFQHGRRWEITDVNPIDLVRQRGGRRSIPRMLSVREIRLVLEELAEPYLGSSGPVSFDTVA